MKITHYNINHIESINDNQKIILPIELHNSNALPLINKPFYYNYDDSRQLYCSYLLDYRHNKQEFVKNKKLVEMFLLKELKIKYFIRSFFDQNPELLKEVIRSQNCLDQFGTYILSSNNKKYNFSKFIIEKQLSTFVGSHETNPIVFLPYLLKEDEEEIISFCKNKLITLVIFDFFNFKIKIEQRLFKTTYDLIKNDDFENKNGYSIMEFDLEIIKAVCSNDEITSIATDFKGELFVVKNFDNLSLKMQEYDACSLFFTMITNSGIYNQFIKYYDSDNSKMEITISLIHYYKTLDFIDYPFSYKQMLKLYQKFVLVDCKNKRVGLQINNQMFSRWTLVEKCSLLELMFQNNTIDNIINIPSFDIESNRGVVHSVEKFDNILEKIRLQFPLLYLDITKTAVESLQFRELFDNINKQGSLELFKMIETHIPIQSINASKIAKNNNFLEIYDNYKGLIFNIEESFSSLPIDIVRNFLKMKYKDKNIATYFADSIAVKHFSLISDLLEYSSDNNLKLNKTIHTLLITSQYDYLLFILKGNKITYSKQLEQTIKLQCYKNACYPAAKSIYFMLSNQL